MIIKNKQEKEFIYNITDKRYLLIYPDFVIGLSRYVLLFNDSKKIQEIKNIFPDILFMMKGENIELSNILKNVGTNILSNKFPKVKFLDIYNVHNNQIPPMKFVDMESLIAQSNLPFDSKQISSLLDMLSIEQIKKLTDTLKKYQIKDLSIKFKKEIKENILIDEIKEKYIGVI